VSGDPDAKSAETLSDAGASSQAAENPAAEAPGCRPSAAGIRRSALIDSGVALILAMLAWPFPLARMLLPVPVNVASLLLFWQVVQACYCALTAGVWGRTGGMLLQGLALVGPAHEEPSRVQRARWGVVYGALLLGTIAGVRGSAPSLASERVANLELRSR
jgi:hypothetical protein